MNFLKQFQTKNNSAVQKRATMGSARGGNVHRRLPMPTEGHHAPVSHSSVDNSNTIHGSILLEATHRLYTAEQG